MKSRIHFFSGMALAGASILAAVAVNPIGDFPLNDDWAYGRAVKSLVEDRILRIPDFVAAPIVSQVAWGTAFCFPSGFSFTALRLSTITLSTIAAVAGYAVFTRSRISARISLLAAFAILLNPVFMGLSYTFMTDVPFYAFSVLSILFFLETLDDRHDGFLAAGTLFLACATLCRQIGLYIPLAFAPTYLLRFHSSRGTWLRAATPLVAAIGVLKGCEALLRLNGGLPALYASKQSRLWELLLNPSSLRELLSPDAHGSLARRSFVAILYLGLFLLPVTIPLSIGRTDGSARKRLRIGLLIFSALLTIGMASLGKLMPLGGNVLMNFGIGPQSLKDSQLGFPSVPCSPQGFRLAITFLAVLGAAWMVALLLRQFWEMRLGLSVENGDHRALFAALASLAYFLPIAVVGYFDRYLLPLLPLVTLTLCVDRGRRRGIDDKSGSFLSMAVLAAFAAFSVGATHDYLSWNRARWEGLRQLMAAGARPTIMDGGMEFNGWHLYSKDYQALLGKSWWWVKDDEFTVSLHLLPGYSQIRSLPYPRWLPPGTGLIYILKRS